MDDGFDILQLQLKLLSQNNYINQDHGKAHDQHPKQYLINTKKPLVEIGDIEAVLYGFKGVDLLLALG